MEDVEKMVLRRRKQHLSEVIDVNDDLLFDIKESALLKDEAINLLLLEKSNLGRASKLIDLVMISRATDSFQLFMSVLSKHYKWLARDLSADLRVERGDVQPDQQTVEEAAVLVHRKFGTSKRFSETDKKEVAEMIAIKLQIARDEWGKETNKIKEELEEERALRQRREEISMKIQRLQKDFVRKHESQLVNHAHDMITTRELIQKILNDEMSGEALHIFKENLDKFLRQMANVLNQRDALYYEKEKCLHLLGLSDTPKVALDKVISKATGLTVNADLQAIDKDEIIKDLRKRLEELERNCKLKAENIKDFRKQLADRDREISKLRRMVHIN